MIYIFSILAITAVQTFFTFPSIVGVYMLIGGLVFATITSPIYLQRSFRARIAACLPYLFVVICECPCGQHDFEAELLELFPCIICTTSRETSIAVDGVENEKSAFEFSKLFFYGMN